MIAPPRRRHGMRDGAPAYESRPALPRHRLLLARTLDVALLRLEEIADLVAQLGRVLVAVNRDRVLGGGADHLFLLADDRERAVRVARPAAAVSDLPGHTQPPFDWRRDALYSCGAGASTGRFARSRAACPRGRGPAPHGASRRR